MLQNKEREEQRLSGSFNTVLSSAAGRWNLKMMRLISKVKSVHVAALSGEDVNTSISWEASNITAAATADHRFMCDSQLFLFNMSSPRRHGNTSVAMATITGGAEC